MPKGLSTTHLQTHSRANLTPRLLSTPIGGTQSQGTVHGDKPVHHVRRSRPAPRVSDSPRGECSDQGRVTLDFHFPPTPDLPSSLNYYTQNQPNFLGLHPYRDFTS